MDAEDSSTVTEQVYTPAAPTDSQLVVLSEEQFTQLRDLGVYQVAGIWALIGILVIIAFWVGWRSTK